jgi:hypothetical protein
MKRFSIFLTTLSLCLFAFEPPTLRAQTDELPYCVSICYTAPNFWSDPATRPKGQIFLDGWNSAPTNSLQTTLSLSGGPSASQQLSREFIALQLSLYAANRNGLPYTLECQGLTLPLIELNNGMSVSGKTTVTELLEITRGTFKSWDAADMQTLTLVLRLLHGDRSFNCRVNSPAPAPPKPCMYCNGDKGHGGDDEGGDKKGGGKGGGKKP